MTRYWHSCLQDHQQQPEFHSRSLKQKRRQHHIQSWWHGELLQSAHREERQLNVTVFVVMTWGRIRWGHYRAEHLNDCEIWETLFERCVSDIPRHESYRTLQGRSLSALWFDALYKFPEQTIFLINLSSILPCTWRPTQGWIWRRRTRKKYYMCLKIIALRFVQGK